MAVMHCELLGWFSVGSAAKIYRVGRVSHSSQCIQCRCSTVAIATRVLGQVCFGADALHVLIAQPLEMVIAKVMHAHDSDTLFSFPATDELVKMKAICVLNELWQPHRMMMFAPRLRRRSAVVVVE